ncbi:hypothetical protein ACH3VR_12810 [Microbacterium sp. B2969]|uniref:TPM domain-containing protein n=1 Tax=Microbacterium alkaliflavum TaxID=3248839 RepID=A0ABW7Q8P4_9MICO
MHVPPFLAALLVTGALAGASAAGAGGPFITDAADALATSNVYVDQGVADGAQLAGELSSEIGDASIGIAVLPEIASTEADASAMVKALYDRMDGKYDTIVVAVGNDVAAGSSALDKGQALGIANEAERANPTSVDDALTQTVQQVIAATPAETSGGGVDGGLIVGLALAVAALLAAGIAVVAVVRRRRARDESQALPEGVEGQVAVLRGLVGEYAAVGASGHETAARTAQEISVLADNVDELFARLDKRSADDQVYVASVEYDDKLRKLTAALNRDYLLDILTHPHLWDDPDDRVREVEGALQGVSDELVENIKQVNARRGLHFQVSLDGLIGRRKELQAWDRAFDQASDDGPPPSA